MTFHKIAMPLEQAAGGGVVLLSFPDNGAGSGYAGFIRHLQLLAKLDPAELVELVSTEKGAALFGQAEFIGGRTGFDLLEPFDQVPEARADELTDEQYERHLRGLPLDEPSHVKLPEIHDAANAVQHFETVLEFSRGSRRA